VILFHTTGYGFTALFFWAHRYRPVAAPNFDAAGTAPYWALRLMEELVCVAIPIFLFVSGYFVSVMAGRTRVVGAGTMRTRIAALIPPYLLWSGIVLLGLALEGRVYPLRRYAVMLATGSTNPNYYYVPLLVQLYLVAPVVVRLLAWNWRVTLAVTGLMQACVYGLQYAIVLAPQSPTVLLAATLAQKWVFLVHLFWFTFGAFVGLEAQRFRTLVDRARPFLVPATVVFFALGVIEWEMLLAWSGQPWTENRTTLVDGAYSASFLMSFLAYAEIPAPWSSWLTTLGSRSFGIYLVHGLVMEYFSRGLYHLAPWALGRQALFLPALIAVGMAVPLMLMDVVNRSPARRAYAYVFG
jgi:surface polysaccharide O-acyltransferase-like enzyme